MTDGKKTRLDHLVVARGLAETRSLAQRLILAGRVRVDGMESIQPGKLLPAETRIELIAPPPYVSRGGEKLAAALDSFHIDPREKICADAGASTGGFTDCLLQRGAAIVYAIDVGKGILDWKLRTDPRVVVMEEQNVRYLETLPQPADLLTVDVAFISLTLLFPVFRSWMNPEAEAVFLIKPQFEAGRRLVGKGGVVRDPAVHRAVLADVLSSAGNAGFCAMGLILSPLKGPAGNIEFLAHMRLGERRGADIIQAMIDGVMQDPSRPSATLPILGRDGEG